MKFSEQIEKYIIEQYNNGISTCELARKLNTYNTSIRRVLKRNNVYIRTCHDVQKTIDNPFKENDELSEYFFGLLLTDGSISKGHEIKLALKDKEMVKSFQQFICPKNKIRTYLDKRFNTYIYSVSVRSLESCDWLQQHGNFINKSYNCDIYTPITPAILRGIFDGDGYWHHTNNGNTLNFGICGASKVFIDKIQSYLQANKIQSYIRKDKRKCLYYLEIRKTIDVLKTANLIYQGASIYLQRKYDTWHLFEETLREKCVKFKEGSTPTNPEPSLYKRFGKEGAETIIRYLNTNKITSA